MEHCRKGAAPLSFPAAICLWERCQGKKISRPEREMFSVGSALPGIADFGGNARKECSLRVRKPQVASDRTN